MLTIGNGFLGVKICHQNNETDMEISSQSSGHPKRLRKMVYQDMHKQECGGEWQHWQKRMSESTICVCCVNFRGLLSTAGSNENDFFPLLLSLTVATSNMQTEVVSQLCAWSS